MDIKTPISDYIAGSLLTTQGDIVIRGASDNERLALGSNYERPEVDSGSLVYHKPGRAFANDILGDTNSGIVSLTSGSYTTIISIDCGTVTIGDVLLPMGRMRIQNGATPQEMSIKLSKSAGTSTVQYVDGLDIINDRRYVPASTWCYNFAHDFLYVTGTGTLTLLLEGKTYTDTRSLSADNGVLSVGFMYKQ